MDATDRRDVTVVGAGVVGLTCALRLAEAGFGVRVLARERGEATTSSVAAAVWYPYRAFPFDRVLGWAESSYHEFVALARAEEAPGSGCGPAPSCCATTGPTRGGPARCPTSRR